MSDTFTTDETVEASTESYEDNLGVEDVEAPEGYEGDAEVASTEPADTELYTIKVDGEEQQVTLDELREGHMRHADYTRKTQELAQQRQALRQAEALAVAIERDPEGTLRALADAYQLPLGQPNQAQADDGGYVDPVEQRINGLEQTLQQQIAAQQQAQARAQIDRDMAELHTSYGNFDEAELVHHAMVRGLDLKTAYRDLNWERQSSREQAVEKKRAAQKVAGGKATQRGVVKPPPKKFTTRRDAIVDALRQHGVEV